MGNCEHSFVFLRQEEREEELTGGKQWKLFDLFFCQKCLELRAVHAKTEVRYDSLDRSRRIVQWERNLEKARS